MTAGVIDCIVTPKQGNTVPEGATYCADNGAYGKGYPGDTAWWAWLQRTVTRWGADRCMFAVAPDVPFDAAGTLDKSLEWLPRIQSLGIRAALAFQDGIENLPIPWDVIDCMFIAGSDEWKLGPHARRLALEAKQRGKWVHMGRVNSEKRFRYAAAIGCDSADGTYVTFGPDKNLPNVRAWLRTNDHPSLFEVTA